MQPGHAAATSGAKWKEPRPDLSQWPRLLIASTRRTRKPAQSPCAVLVTEVQIGRPVPVSCQGSKCLYESQIGGHVGSRSDSELIGPLWNVSRGRAIG